MADWVLGDRGACPDLGRGDRCEPAPHRRREGGRGPSGHTVQARYDALDATPVAYLAGALIASVGGAAAVDAYCVDLYHDLYVGGGGSSFQIDPLPIAQLGPPGGNGNGVGYLYKTLAPTALTDIQAAGLQIAIWKVEYDNGGSLTTGHLTLEDSSDLGSNQHLVFTQATTDLALYDGSQVGAATWYRATEHPSNGQHELNQNLIGPGSILFGTDTVPTPEPGTLASGLIGISIVAGFLLRKTISLNAGRLS